MNQICRLSPTEVDEMGWFDLINFTILVDDENAEARRRMNEARARSGQRVMAPQALPPGMSTHL